MNVVFRCDASVEIGSGHVMRCLTLANALATSLTTTANIHFICRAEPGHLASLIEQHGYQISLLSAASSITEVSDARQSLSVIDEDCQLLIVDHYRLAAEYSQQLRQRCHKIMVIDDLANRRHDCDILLDQNFLPDAESRYQQLVSEQCLQLLGPRYVLLREEFYQRQTPLFSERQNRLLVFFGGADPFNLTKMAVQALSELKFPDLTADIVIGATHPLRSELEHSCAVLPGVSLHVQCNYMARLMYQARLMLGAGGASHWERCKCALPALVVTVAENQQATTAYLARLGACVWLGQAAEMSAGYFAEQLRYYLTQPALLNGISAQAATLMPATGGTQAVVSAIKTLVRG
ncbi:UDP-2,4-diacetamido-2,4,6-trideoxy-beta-L-altropyranose hydrolase [Arsukibacterium indicum]|uniref:UDP-2,4-diacetamido-2,4, 6-trideoxy-beta-L-altropyranose hydrolase n=1 Tax=Arsukibacterium indicum TaxID=2848612 RepID=A0ABS6MGB8_9GAMM|nr:UDP-2,4-diacetamido-2,4,6-trideoxy-beta-L-altropyranose hydrolase [Arsukibacterium indicum]MBV2127866.1 UDP-2,4-diacetamido-2,4,6-trideoxy-beta-L-altropyranose hydrolase [Arsukibacterium indicum]